MKLSVAPIVLFAFNRPKHLKDVVQNLKLNELSKRSALHVSESETLIYDMGAKAR